ncbi:hypothetical protein ASPZODRAFT_20828 [Penicilliopsis zonata CBS 506.65]|uniref:Uncharacterized protein n=1 Tax=Penicilliopsis zonata CBS 506.65 TaxID=1073090 RepID=A0A1L9S4I6_9EURO|nr:hypothetical protein ASPZODRAFT_20828 [Penicilliopsis zonata CBS 506.65]OJJ42068.1 hypothetical protein ASPZODRAFT_20828 [Penicilliopsis zonata CBS 506.65]
MPALPGGVSPHRRVGVARLPFPFSLFTVIMSGSSSPDYKALFLKEASLRRQAEEERKQAEERERQAEERERQAEEQARQEREHN